MKRESSSGSSKIVYAGDSVLVKQLHNILPKIPKRLNRFNLMVEVKSGYKEEIPTIYRRRMVEDWFIKSIEDGCPLGQTIVFLICQFKNMSKVFFTNYKIFY